MGRMAGNGAGWGGAGRVGGWESWLGGSGEGCDCWQRQAKVELGKYGFWCGGIIGGMGLLVKTEQ